MSHDDFRAVLRKTLSQTWVPEKVRHDVLRQLLIQESEIVLDMIANNDALIQQVLKETSETA